MFNVSKVLVVMLIFSVPAMAQDTNQAITIVPYQFVPSPEQMEFVRSLEKTFINPHAEEAKQLKRGPATFWHWVGDSSSGKWVPCIEGSTALDGKEC